MSVAPQADRHDEIETSAPIETIKLPPVSAPVFAPPLPWWQRRTVTTVLLLLIIGLGAYFSFFDLNWDQGQHLHPDERFLTMVTNALAWPTSLGQYLNEAQSTLNPRNMGYQFYDYGMLITTVVKGVSLLLGRDNYADSVLVGRAISACYNVGSIIMLFFLARRVYRDARVALLAAFLLATSVLAIQYAHFFVSDGPASFYSIVALYFIVSAQQTGRGRQYVLAGLFAALATACKISSVPLMGLLGLATVVRVWPLWHEQSPRAWGSTVREASRLLVGCVVFLVAFRIAEPDAFSGVGMFGWGFSDRWISNLQYAAQLVSGAADIPPGVQWAGRARVIFPLSNIIVVGLGVPLGITAWVGWAAAGWRMIRRADMAHLMPVLWVGGIFAYEGIQWVSTMRYFLPIYGTLDLLAAWLLISLWDGQWWQRLPHALAALFNLAGRSLIVIVPLLTLCWAIAFFSIYTRPLSRVTASQWIYDHVPVGSSISAEAWDDSLPVSLDGKSPFPNMYRGVTMTWYDQDSPAKLQSALGWLDSTDYIVLSSNRLYKSIPRIPAKYPMTILYYKYLFNGQLGYKLVADISSYPTIFGHTFPDQNAEEAFTVYDHPLVLIFHKTAAYSHAKAASLLGAVDWSSIFPVTSIQMSSAPNMLLLPPAVAAAQQAGGTWMSIFHPQALANKVPVLVWALLLEVLGLIGAPYLFGIVRRFPDRGYGLAKTGGLLLVSWLIWLLASLHVVQFTLFGCLVAVLLAAAGGALLWRRNRADIAEFVAAHWRLLLWHELLFWICFLGFVAIRYANPDLWHPSLGGEKPMDFSFLNAVIKSTYFPPYDPWFSGGAMNYYYFGFVLMAVLTKITGIIPTVAYNLALPTLFALTAAGAATVSMGLIHRAGQRVARRDLLASVFGAMFVSLIGNLDEGRLLMQGFIMITPTTAIDQIPVIGGLVRIVQGVPLIISGTRFPFALNWWYWNATRAIDPTQGSTINEMPFFTYLFGDLHAHGMALPLTLLSLGISISLALSTARTFWQDVGALLASGLVLGALWMTNTWDLPTYGLVLACALGVQQWQHDGRLTPEGVVRAAWRAGLVLALAYAFFLPFHRTYGSAYSKIQSWTGPTTALGDYLTMNGFFLFVILSAFVIDVVLHRRSYPALRLLSMLVRLWTEPDQLWRFLRLQRRMVHPHLMTVLGPCLAVLGFIMGMGMIFQAMVAQGLAIWVFTFMVVMVPSRTDVQWRLVVILAAIGVGLTIFIEYFVLVGDIGRMNTVFKFYYQAWVLMGVAAAVGAVRVWEALRAWHPAWAPGWRTAFVLLFACTILYPIFATTARVQDRFTTATGPGLDGSTFMDQAQYGINGHTFSLAADRQAITWIDTHINGSPVIVEENTDPVLYGWGDHITMFTGLPDVVGWGWHETQQRSSLPSQMVTQRIADVQLLYSTTDVGQATTILQRYHVRYIVVGNIARALAPPVGIAKFSQVGVPWHLVYTNGQVQIYRVNQASGA